ncbi:MAG: DUF5818 domain-containing protein [Candidatus Sulfotelmatobacter sp.]
MRHLLLISMLLLGTSWALAQDSNSSTPSQTSSQATAVSAGGQQMIKGCLSGSDGSYTLTATNGQSYRLTGDTAKLSDHVGHEMKVTGTVSSASASTSGENPNGSMSQTGAAQQTIDVTSFKHISKTCENAGAAH